MFIDRDSDSKHTHAATRPNRIIEINSYGQVFFLLDFSMFIANDLFVVVAVFLFSPLVDFLSARIVSMTFKFN